MCSNDIFFVGAVTHEDGNTRGRETNSTMWDEGSSLKYHILNSNVQDVLENTQHVYGDVWQAVFLHL